MVALNIEAALDPPEKAIDHRLVILAVVQMKPNLSISCPAFIALLFVWSVCKCSGTLSPVLLSSGAADSDKTGCYIVVLKDDTTHERFIVIKSQVVSMTEDKELHGSVEAVVKAFTVKLPAQALFIVSACS